MRRIDTTLYFITDSTGWDEDEFLRRVELALMGGATIMQLAGEKPDDERVYGAGGKSTYAGEKISGASHH